MILIHHKYQFERLQNYQMSKNTNKRPLYRRIKTKLDFLRSCQEKTKFGRHTQSSKMRIAYQLMQSGKVVLSDSRSVVFPLDQSIPISRGTAQQSMSDHRPVYIDLAKSVSNQLAFSGEKLHSFLLGSSIASELKRLLRHRKPPTCKLLIEDPGKSVGAVNELDAFSGPTKYPLRSNAHREGCYGAPGTTPRDKDIDVDKDLIHSAVTSISKPLRLHLRSGSENLKYWQNGATVQLTIIGGARRCKSKENLSLKKSSQISSSLYLPTSADQTKHLAQISTIRPRVVSIPYKPEHEFVGGLDVRAESMCVIGSRPGSALPPAKNDSDFSHVVDQKMIWSLRTDMKQPTLQLSVHAGARPCSAHGVNNESYKETFSIRQIQSARFSRESVSTISRKNLFIAGHTAPCSPKRPVSVTKPRRPQQRSTDKLIVASAAHEELAHPPGSSVIHIPTITMTDEDDSTSDPVEKTGNDDAPVRVSPDDMPV